MLLNDQSLSEQSALPDSPLREEQTQIPGAHMLKEQEIAVLQESKPHPQAGIHSIQAGKGGRTIFLMHGNWTGGVPFYCYTVARTLGKKQPFYALDPYVYQGPDKPMSIEEMASAHIQSLKTIQPQGPYILSGFCNGSILAYEMARQLQEAGEQIELLLLIAPTNLPSSSQLLVRTIHTVLSVLRVPMRTQMISFLAFRHMVRHIYRMVRRGDVKVQDFPKLLAIDPHLARMFPAREALLNDYVGVFTWLASAYQKRYRPAHVQFIWSAKELDSREAWKDLGGLEQGAIVPGTHMESVTDFTDLLAQEFMKCMHSIC